MPDGSTFIPSLGQVVLAVSTSDREASRAFVEAMFGPAPAPKPVLPPVADQLLALSAEMARHRALGVR